MKRVLFVRAHNPGRSKMAEALHRYNNLRAGMIEDSYQREIALIDEKYRYEIAKAKEAGDNDVSLAALAGERKLEMDAAVEKHRREADEKEKERRREITEFNIDTAQEIAELQIQAATKEGPERELALAKYHKQQAIAAAIAMGADVEAVRKKWDLQIGLMRVGREETSGFGVGTFSKWALGGLGMGGGPAERTAANTEKTVALLEEIRRAKQTPLAVFGP